MPDQPGIPPPAGSPVSTGRHDDPAGRRPARAVSSPVGANLELGSNLRPLRSPLGRRPPPGRVRCLVLRGFSKHYRCPSLNGVSYIDIADGVRAQMGPALNGYLEPSLLLAARLAL